MRRVTDWSLREVKKARTRELLVETALRMFADRGYHETTVEDICREALVSPRTFLRYFGTKADVAFGDHRELLALFRTTAEEALAEGRTLASALEAANRATGEALLADPHTPTRKAIVAREPALGGRRLQLRQDYEQVIGELIAATTGIPSGSVRVRVATGAISGAFNAFVDPILTEPSLGAGDFREASGAALDVLEGGLRDMLRATLRTNAAARSRAAGVAPKGQLQS